MIRAENIRLLLAPAPGEDEDVQEYQDALRAFEGDLKKGGLGVSQRKKIRGFGPPGTFGLLTEHLTGDFFLDIVTVGGSVISLTLGAWIKGRFGRRARLEFYADGNVKKIEVRTPDEIRAVLEMLPQGTETKPTVKKLPHKGHGKSANNSDPK